MVRISLEDVERIINTKVNSDPSATVEVHVASTVEEFQAGRNVVADAFVDYVLFRWLLEEVKEKEQRRQAVHWILGVFQRLCIFSGIVLVAKDKKTGEIVGTAQINHKNKPRSILARYANKVILTMYMLYHVVIGGGIGLPFFAFRTPVALGGKRGAACHVIDESHAKVLGSREHLHLIQLAAEPTGQSKGVGGALLNALKAIQEEYQLPAYLETNTERHCTYYGRHGFKVEIEYEIDAGGGDVFKPNYGLVRNL